MKGITVALTVTLSVACAWAGPRALAQEDSVSAPANYSVFPPLGNGPACRSCGALMTPNGSCYTCRNCGGTSGCS